MNVSDDPRAKASKFASFLKLLLKIGITVLCLWWVFKKIDVREIIQIIHQANWYWLTAATGIYVFSKLVASRRLNIYFQNVGVPLSETNNLRLYWLGMFYNLFLPGAITGDAYKVIVLKKRFQADYKKTSAAVLLDRFSGLLALGMIVAGYSIVILPEPWWSVWMMAGALLAIPTLYWVIKKFFADFLPGFWSTFLYGVVVQLLSLSAVYCILFAIHMDQEMGKYIFIFLIAAIASVLPISVGGGLGVREFVIIQGAQYFELNEHTALILSLVYYVITLFCSLLGAFYVFKDPLAPLHDAST